MIKSNNKPEKFLLRNKWHDKIENDLKIKNLPYTYEILEQVPWIGDKNPAWFAEYEEKKKKTRIIISGTVLDYLGGEEKPDCNAGMYFGDYLPDENCYIITYYKNKLVATQFVFVTFMEEHEGEQFISIDMVLKDVITGDQYKVGCVKNSMWKFIAYKGMIENAIRKIKTPKTLNDQAEDIGVYMNNAERMFQDTIIHKVIVQFVMNKFADILEEVAESHKQEKKATKDKNCGFKYMGVVLQYNSVSEILEDVQELRKSADIHDNSKLTNKVEFQALTGIIDDKSCLKDPKATLTAYKQDSIELHWKNNAHHPEHYEKPDDMPRTKRYEFVCDCYSRSLQYGTELIDFMTVRQEDRFHFPEEMYDEIMKYCLIAKTIKSS